MHAWLYLGFHQLRGAKTNNYHSVFIEAFLLSGRLAIQNKRINCHTCLSLLLYVTGFAKSACVLYTHLYSYSNTHF